MASSAFPQGRDGDVRNAAQEMHPTRSAVMSIGRSIEEDLHIGGAVLGPVEGDDRVAFVGMNGDAKLSTAASTTIGQTINSRLGIQILDRRLGRLPISGLTTTRQWMAVGEGRRSGLSGALVRRTRRENQAGDDGHDGDATGRRHISESTRTGAIRRSIPPDPRSRTAGRETRRPPGRADRRSHGPHVTATRHAVASPRGPILRDPARVGVGRDHGFRRLRYLPPRRR